MVAKGMDAHPTGFIGEAMGRVGSYSPGSTQRCHLKEPASDAP